MQFKITTSQVQLIENLIINNLCVAHEILACIVTESAIEVAVKSTNSEILNLLNTLQMLKVDLSIISIRCDI